MINLIIGALATGTAWGLSNYARQRNLTLKTWQWAVTVAGILYAVLVLEVIVGFLAEGAPQAALLMGGMMALVAVAWGVLLGRFVFVSTSEGKEIPLTNQS